ncbi:MAG: valS [Chlamydiales bacterium]|jgi:valyl-tRNA synthetase|nr:valS [Chlamydiales bacterium]
MVKKMEQEIPKTYDPKQVDQKWYHFWKENKYFKADPNSNKPPFCIVIPPPNVTGQLHMGHALGSTLQDVLIRWARMCGHETLWVPGTDHAGISTQTVVERHLMVTEGKRRKDYNREDFLKHVWQWKEEKENRILSQLQLMGCSCDWEKCRFTMDPDCNAAVRKVFKKMFDEGLIYRGDYLVNWDPVTQTALADDEVEYEDRSSFLWHMKYPFADGSGEVIVATTRPETMLGDTAVAVHPSDVRYASQIGKLIKLPITGRLIPLLADNFVDPEFGTGAVKITPAHDPNDYQMGLRHNLPMINIMTPDGRLNEVGGAFAGQTMAEARLKIVEELKKEGFLDKQEPHQLRVGLSYRSKAVIEPYLSKQWFVKMEPFKAKLRSAVESGKVKITPKSWENTYFHWIDNLRDWCISRQLWWGHRIPIWYHKNNPEKIVCYEGDGVPPEVAHEPESWIQDEDVLDTWFSSGLWPFSALGWPRETADLKKFYPNNVLVTGHDILFFWVARMLFMGEYIMGEFPFPEIFLSGLIYGKSYWRNRPEGGIVYVDEKERIQYDLAQKSIPKDVHSKWEKMSKSKGNVIDPLELIQEYGTDAVRMALCASAPQSRQIDLDRRRFEDFKNFANKVWNGARFVFMNLIGDSSKGLSGLTGEEFIKGIQSSPLSQEDRWILSRLNRTIEEVNRALSEYAFERAAMTAYEFYWKEFCAYYVEMVKPFLFGKEGNSSERTNKQRILAITLCTAIQLLHPMTPFITEELFQMLKDLLKVDSLDVGSGLDDYTKATVRALKSAACIVSPYPQKPLAAADISAEVEEAFNLMDQVVYTIRNIRGEMQVPPSTSIDAYLVTPNSSKESDILHKYSSSIRTLAKVEKLNFVEADPALKFCSTGAIGEVRIIVPVPAEQIQQELVRLQKEQDRLDKSIEKIVLQLNNSEFVANAPPVVVEKQKQQLQQLQIELKTIQQKLQTLS